MKKAIVCAFFLGGCGPALEEGTYDVQINPTQDTCGDGATVESEWAISGVDERWTITNTETGFVASGIEDGDEIDFTADYVFTVQGCQINARYVFTVVPGGDEFTGDGTINATALCDQSTCMTLFDLAGSLQD
jgi:hypothetical protein